VSPSPEAERRPTSAYDYALPPELIAHHPARRRDESRLMVLDRAAGTIAHHIFRELPDFVPAGDAVVLNETRVFPARLVGTRPGGGAAEVLLLRPANGQMGGWGDGEHRASAAAGPVEASGKSENSLAHEAPGHPPSPHPPIAPSDVSLWEALVRPGAKLKPGRRIEIGPDLAVQIVASRDDGTRVVRLDTPLPIDVALERYGRVPLPPYIDREPEADDTERYQTVYARERGSVAAPTAGLHFTPAVLERLQSGGAGLVRLVLHVGVGTFRPVEVEDPARHRMHAEWYRVPGDAAASLNRTRQAGGRIWCVGTTVARTLETVTDPAGVVHAGAGWTDIFIRPPHTFRAMDRLVTNFHLPRSTLLMLVAAFAGLELVLEAYAEAVRRGYRFYSYGDAMLIL